MSVATEIDYLAGIVQNDFATLQQIYKASLPEVIKHIKRNSGTVEDAKDVFQEAILIIFNKAKKGELILTTSFHVYLFGVCKRIWLKKISRNKYKMVSLPEEKDLAYEEDFEEKFLKTQKWRLFNQKFQLLAEECRTVLELLFNGQSGKAIASAMGYTEAYAKRKKYKCKLSLMELIKKDASYQGLLQ